MEYRNQVIDFLNRCDVNLDKVKSEGGYEFTQLFSNLISALIFIKENRMIDRNPINCNGLSCKVIKNTYKKDFSQDTQEFIRHLRNACCHYGIDIRASKGEICSVIFKDRNNYKGTYCECEFELTVEEIEKVYEYLKSKI